MIKRLIPLILTPIFFIGCVKETINPIKIPVKMVEKTVDTGVLIIKEIFNNTDKFTNTIFDNKTKKNIKKKSKHYQQYSIIETKDTFDISIFEQHNEFKNEIKTFEDIKHRIHMMIGKEVTKKIYLQEKLMINKVKYKKEKEELKIFFTKMKSEVEEIVSQSVDMNIAQIIFQDLGIECDISVDKQLLKNNFKKYLDYNLIKHIKKNKFEIK